MDEFIRTAAISPLRQRLIDDMTMRRFSRETQRNYIRDVGRFATFLGRSPHTATADDLRRFQIEQRKAGVPTPTMNSIVSALRFLFTNTLDRPDLARKLVRVAHPRNLPVVLSREEVARLLAATTSLKHQTALSVAYGAGLRVAEVAALKIADVDSERMLIRVVPRSVADNANAGRFQFYGKHAGLCDRSAFLRHLAPVRKKPWIVYAKPPFAGPAAVLADLSRYTHRVAISNRRLIALDGRGVTFRYKDYRRNGAERYQVMTLATDEFIRRFLLHVMPKGFHRIRHDGLLACADRRANIGRARELLAVPPVTDAVEAVETSDHRPPCPCCGGRMLILETFERYAQPRAPPRPTCSAGRSSP
jgi:integrase